MEKICAKCGDTSNISGIDDTTACPACGAIYWKTDKAASTGRLKETAKQSNEPSQAPPSPRPPKANSRYSANNLIPGESVIYEARVSIWALIPNVFFALLLTAIGLSFGSLGLLYILFGAILLIKGLITYFATELVITDKRLITKFGFIRRRTVEMQLSKAESVQVDQSMLGRALNFGDIVISGAGNPTAKVPFITSPIDFRNEFFSIQDQPATA